MDIDEKGNITNIRLDYANGIRTSGVATRAEILTATGFIGNAGSCAGRPSCTTCYESGDKKYELTNHLGNVLAVISDRRVYTVTGSLTNTVAGINATTPGTSFLTNIGYAIPDILATNDYYPFGELMPGRTYNSTDFRYGFNGKEKDDELNGSTGSSYDYGFRIYNPALGRFLSEDPLSKQFVWNSTYSYAENDVIRSIDMDGLEKYEVHYINNESVAVVKMVDADKTDGLVVKHPDGKVLNNFKYKQIQEFITTRTKVENGVQYIPKEVSSDKFAEGSEGLVANKNRTPITFNVDESDEKLPEDYFDPKFQPVENVVGLSVYTVKSSSLTLSTMAKRGLNTYLKKWSSNKKIDKILIYASTEALKQEISKYIKDAKLDDSKVEFTDKQEFSKMQFEVQPKVFKKAKGQQK